MQYFFARWGGNMVPSVAKHTVIFFIFIFFLYFTKLLVRKQGWYFIILLRPPKCRNIKSNQICTLLVHLRKNTYYYHLSTQTNRVTEILSYKVHFFKLDIQAELKSCDKTIFWFCANFFCIGWGSRNWTFHYSS